MDTAEPNPNVCDSCGHSDLRDLYVCTSSHCAPNTARCVSWCCGCQAKIPCKNRHHVSCWDRHLPGKVERRASHSMRPAKDQVRINEIFHCETDPQKQKVLHLQDKEARWFIIGPSCIQEDTASTSRCGEILYITNRFEYLTHGNIESQFHSVRFPSLVSFIGETGAGKSTLIRALIKLYSSQPQEVLKVPVTRIRNTENLTSPTSSGVHLYKDPNTFASKTPILFADCEGFNAGAAVPTSYNGWDFRDGEHVIQKLRITSSLYDHPYPRRSNGVEDLYSRFLYAFSDVVCLVSRNAQTITRDIEKLLIWSSEGLQTSVNQTQQKTLILVLNATINHNHDLMDEGQTYDYIFKDMAEVWKNSSLLKNRRESINQVEADRQKEIYSTKDFILRYFQSIRVCYIPLQKNINSNEIQTQCNLLRKQITQGCKETAEARSKTWTQYNIQDLSRLFNQAFEHFATKDTAFDFYTAARRDNPNPQTMEDHIMNLLRHIERAENLESTDSFSKIVASCIMNNSLRGGQFVQSPHELWQKDYKVKCNNGITQFYEQHATCQFHQGTIRCIYKYTVHDRVHRDKEGNEIGTGPFKPREVGFCTSRKNAQIEKQFYQQYRQVCEDDKQHPRKPSPSDIVAYRKTVLGGLSNLCNTLYSYKTCFSCLSAVPDHVLPCGHAQCENCISDFGERSLTKEAEITLRRCVLCPQSWDQKPQLIQTKPPCAGIRVLTLDGGGIRGILELEILKKIEDIIGLDIPIHNFFDLVVGTSTGGIIALGLAMKDLSSKDMAERFTEISTLTFKHTRGPKINLVQALSQKTYTKTILFLTKLWESVYDSHPLGKGLRDILGESSMFGSAISSKVQRYTRVAVMTVKDTGRQATAIANYNRPASGGNDDFERAENEEDEIKAWEAGLCTSAAPIYLPPFIKVLEATRTPYLDGSLLYNNPIFWASRECKKIWHNSQVSSQDIVVSLGTGYFPNHRRELPIISTRYSTAAILNSYFENIDGECTWEKFKREATYNPRIHHRINVQFNGKHCALDQYDRIEELVKSFNTSYDCQVSTDNAIKYAGEYLRHKIDLVARLLVAKLFFFQPTCRLPTDKRDGIYRLAGKILCRLKKDSTALKILVERIDKFSTAEIKTEAMIEKTEAKALMTGDIFKREVRIGGRFEINLTIETMDPKKMLQVIFVKMKPDSESSAVQNTAISGFPCTFDDLAMGVVVSRN